MNLISSLRINFGLSQVVIASMLGVSRSYISRMEKGERSIPSRLYLKLIKLEEQLITLQYAPKSYRVKRRLQTKEDIEFKIVTLQRRLKRMEDTFRDCNEELQRLELLRTVPHSELREMWFDMKIYNLKLKLKSCNPEIQDKLRTELQRWKEI